MDDGPLLRVCSLLSSCDQSVDGSEASAAKILSAALCRLNVEAIAHLTAEECLEAAILLLNRGKIELLIMESKNSSLMETLRIVVSEPLRRQLLITLALAVVEATGRVSPTKERRACALSLDELCAIGAQFIEFIREVDYGHVTSQTEPRSTEAARHNPPRRVLVGQVSQKGGLLLDIAIEWDRHHVAPKGEKSPAGTWSVPGFRLLFASAKKTVAYALIELVGESSGPERSGGLGWALRGMAVDEGFRGRALGHLILTTWLYLAQKIGAIPTTRRIKKPLISLALLKVGFMPINTETAIAVELEITDADARTPINRDASHHTARNDGEDDTKKRKRASLELDESPVKLQKICPENAHSQEKGCLSEAGTPEIRIWSPDPARVLSVISRSEMKKLGLCLFPERPASSRTVYVNASYALPRHAERAEHAKALSCRDPEEVLGSSSAMFGLLTDRCHEGVSSASSPMAEGSLRVRENRVVLYAAKLALAMWQQVS